MTVRKIIFIAFIITIISGCFERKYKGVIGNLCDKTVANPAGHCYEQLPQRGFPIAHIRDIGVISVPRQLGFEDFKFKRFIYARLANTLIYFSSKECKITLSQFRYFPFGEYIKRPN